MNSYRLRVRSPGPLLVSAAPVGAPGGGADGFSGRGPTPVAPPSIDKWRWGLLSRAWISAPSWSLPSAHWKETSRQREGGNQGPEIKFIVKVYRQSRRNQLLFPQTFYYCCCNLMHIKVSIVYPAPTHWNVCMTIKPPAGNGCRWEMVRDLHLMLFTQWTRLKAILRILPVWHNVFM